MANDRRQVEIERELRKFNYSYLRKRQSKSEAKRFIGAHHRVVTKEEVAQAVAACELDPYLVRLGKEGLFEEQLYTKVFPTSDPLFYLTRYRLMRAVSRESKGYPERAYAKWLVLHVAWKQLATLVRAKSAANAFRECSEAEKTPMVPLGRALTTMFRAALKMYKQAKGSSERGLDVSTYFKHKDRAKDFEQFLAGPGRPFRQMFTKHWQRFQTGLRALDTERSSAKKKAEH
jgi:AIPR protein